MTVCPKRRQTMSKKEVWYAVIGGYVGAVSNAGGAA